MPKALEFLKLLGEHDSLLTYTNKQWDFTLQLY